MGLALAYYGAPHAPGGLGRGLDVGWFAPSYKLLDEAWRSAKAFLKAMIARTDAQQHRMELRNGAALDCWTLEDEDAGRGRRYGLVIVDEAAMARHLEQAWTAAIRPTLTDHAGGAWFLSTPKGRNYFHALSLQAQQRDDWNHHHAPTSANPHITADEIEQARQTLPERIFAQEYLAQFLEDGGGVFRLVTAAVDTGLPVEAHWARDAGDGRAYVIGVDWGRHEDFTVIIVIDAKERAVVAVDRFTQIDYAVQLARLRALHERFPRAPILAESNSMGGPLVEALQRMRLPVRAFQTTSASKAEAIEALALAFERGELRLPMVRWLIDELLAFDQERLPSGSMRYGAPKGGHDDGVMALAIAWSGICTALRPSFVAANAPGL
ncbi:MAG: hypothetical protein HYZ20_19685 [Burkholderiales bacterium]|nr:hypothetical protein [Burkholderiales bacterium]